MTKNMCLSTVLMYNLTTFHIVVLVLLDYFLHCCIGTFKHLRPSSKTARRLIHVGHQQGRSVSKTRRQTELDAC